MSGNDNKVTDLEGIIGAIQKDNELSIINKEEKQYVTLKGYNFENYPVKVMIENYGLNVEIPDKDDCKKHVKFKHPIKEISELKRVLYKYNKCRIDKLIEQFKYVHKNTENVNGNNSYHVKLDINKTDKKDCVFQDKSTVKELVNNFRNSEETDENKLKELFEKFWNGNCISAVQQGANAGNLYKHYPTKNNKTVYNNAIEEIRANVNEIIGYKQIDDFEKMIGKQGIAKYDRMKNSALELYYSYHLNDKEKHFPNWNSTDQDGLAFFEKLLGGSFFTDDEKKIFKDKRKRMDKIIKEFNP